jgi:hypothetical protein
MPCPTTGRTSGVSARMHGPAWRDANEGFCPPRGSAAPLTPYASGLAGRSSSTATTAACRTVRTSPDPVVDGRWARLRASPRLLADRKAQQRHGNERGDMTEQIRNAGRELVSIHSQEAAEVSALLREMSAMVARLGRETREMRQEIAQLRTAAVRTTAEPSSAPRLPGAIPDAPR